MPDLSVLLRKKQPGPNRGGGGMDNSSGEEFLDVFSHGLTPWAGQIIEIAGQKVGSRKQVSAQS